MIYTTQRGEAFDLEKDFSAARTPHTPEIACSGRIWPPVSRNFAAKKQEALGKGWGDSGPVQESRNLQSLTRDLEEQVAQRLRAEKPQ